MIQGQSCEWENVEKKSDIEIMGRRSDWFASHFPLPSSIKAAIVLVFLANVRRCALVTKVHLAPSRGFDAGGGFQSRRIYGERGSM